MGLRAVKRSGKKNSSRLSYNDAVEAEPIRESDTSGPYPLRLDSNLLLHPSLVPVVLYVGCAVSCGWC